MGRSLGWWLALKLIWWKASLFDWCTYTVSLDMQVQFRLKQYIHATLSNCLAEFGLSFKEVCSYPDIKFLSYNLWFWRLEIFCHTHHLFLTWIYKILSVVSFLTLKIEFSRDEVIAKNKEKWLVRHNEKRKRQKKNHAWDSPDEDQERYTSWSKGSNATFFFFPFNFLYDFYFSHPG